MLTIMLRMLKLIEHGNGVVLRGDFATVLRLRDAENLGWSRITCE